MKPDNNSGAGEVAALPRRVRFYHAKIDAGNLAAGEEYNALRNVVVIFITTYDPFGLKRMVYTIKNSCVEEPGLLYEDGARTIFLYMGGRQGNLQRDCGSSPGIRDKGKAEGKAEDIMDLLGDIGPVPEELEKRLREQKDLEVLQKWLKLAARAKSMEEFERQIGGGNVIF